MTRPRLTVLLSLFAIPLAGCAGGGGKQAAARAAAKHRPLVVAVAPRHMKGLKYLHGARLLSPTRLAIVTAGSSGCPSVPHRLLVRTPHAIDIRLIIKTPPNGACLDNLVATPIVIAIDPKQIDVHHRLTIRLYYPTGVLRKSKPVVLSAAGL